MSFVVSHDGLRLAMTAHYWSQDPAERMGIEDPVVATALVEALAVRRSVEIQRQADQAERRQRSRRLPGRQLPKGMRYVTEADVEPW